jgi:hypothetical protein
MTGRSPLRRRRSALDCRAIEEEEEEEEEEECIEHSECRNKYLSYFIVVYIDEGRVRNGICR